MGWGDGYVLNLDLSFGFLQEEVNRKCLKAMD